MPPTWVTITRFTSTDWRQVLQPGVVTEHLRLDQIISYRRFTVQPTDTEQTGAEILLVNGMRYHVRDSGFKLREALGIPG